MIKKLKKAYKIEINHTEYISNNQDMKWIKEVSSKVTKQAIMNGDGFI